MTLEAIALMFAEVETEQGLPKGLLHALCFVESSHRPKVINKNDGGEDSLGICQIKKSTSDYLGLKYSREDLLNPRKNATAAAMYLNYQFNRYGSWLRSVVAYNRGSSSGEIGNEYSRKVFKEMQNARSKRKSVKNNRTDAKRNPNAR